MQIQLPSTSASAAAAGVAQTAVRDRGSSVGEAQTNTPASVEKVARSESSSADRDAQGGGDGPLDRHPDHSQTHAPSAHKHDSFDGLPVSSSEPPSLLDIVG